VDKTNNFFFFLMFIFIKRKGALYLDITKKKKNKRKYRKNPCTEGFIFLNPVIFKYFCYV
jgi:hypothetical protein